MGKRIETFPEYARLTDAHLFSGPDELLNEAFQYRNSTWLQAWAKHKALQTGDGIKDFVELDTVATGEFISANHKFDIQGTDGSTEYSTQWAIYANYMTWEKEEKDMNEGDRMRMYKRLYSSKRMRMRGNTIYDLENAMWATPTLAMEDPSTLGNDVNRKPFSIPALITPSGTAPSQWSSTVSTVMGINPSTKTSWKNQYTTFSNFESEIEGKLFDMFLLSQWQDWAVPDAKITGTPEDGLVLYMDAASLKSLRNILRNSNDRLTSLGQYDRGITFMGKPCVWANPLGDTTTTTANQKVYGVNYDFLFPICRDGFFMKITDDEGKPFRPHNQPRTNILYEFTEYNWWARSRKRQFLIANG